MSSSLRLLLCLFALVLAGGAPASAKRVEEVRPWTRLRDDGIVKQQLEYSCGMASVATVLNRFYGIRVGEPALIAAYTKDLPAARLQRIATVGFSLRDLQLAAALHKVSSKGYQMTLQGLRDAKGPVLLHLVIKGQRHFCVLGELTATEVLLLDPSRGRVRLSVERFMAEWTGYCLVFAVGP